MNNATHEYKLEVGEYTFKGDVEISNAGILGVMETGNEMMPVKVKESVRKILDILGTLPATYTDLKTFKLSLK